MPNSRDLRNAWRHLSCRTSAVYVTGVHKRPKRRPGKFAAGPRGCGLSLSLGFVLRQKATCASVWTLVSAQPRWVHLSRLVPDC